MGTEDKLTIPFYHVDDTPTRPIISNNTTMCYDEDKIIDDFQKYRQKHKRCKFCLYCKNKKVTIGTKEYSLPRCTLKDKYLREEPFNRLQGCFCRWYKIKEEKNEI